MQVVLQDVSTILLRLLQDVDVHIEFLIHALDQLGIFRLGDGEDHQVFGYDTNVGGIEKYLEDMM